VIDRLFLECIHHFRMPTVGGIFTAAKILYLLNPKPTEPLDMMVLLGDPMTEYPYPREGLEVKVSEPKLVRDGENPLELRFEARAVDPSLLAALDKCGYRAYAYISTPEHEVVWEEDGLELESPEVRKTVMLPATVPVGEGRVGVYLYPAGEESLDGIPDAIGSATFTIEEDPRVEEELRSRVQPDGKPDLRIASLVLEPTEPVSGHTIFIRATVVNDGTAEAEGIDLIGFQVRDGGETRIHAWKPREEDRWTLEKLYPGQEGTVTLRWDPFDNAGRQVVRVDVDPQNRIKESNEENNSATAETVVKTKADLIVVNDLVHSAVKDGTRYLQFRLVNLGQSPTAQEFRADLRFYADREGEHVEQIPFYFTKKEPDRWPMKPRQYFDTQWTPVPKGAKWVEILVDPDDIVDEETHENDRVFMPLDEVKELGRD